MCVCVGARAVAVFILTLHTKAVSLHMMYFRESFIETGDKEENVRIGNKIRGKQISRSRALL